MQTDTLRLGCAMFVAVLFLSSGTAKVLRYQYFVSAVHSWGMTSPRTSRMVARLLPPAEVVLGSTIVISALWGRGLTEVMLAGVGAFLVFLTAQVGITIHDRGKTAHCGCFARPSPVGAQSIVRTALFLSVSLLALPLL